MKDALERETEVLLIRLDMIDDAPVNPNVMEPETYARLVDAIRRFGFLQPVLLRELEDSGIDTRFEIVDGHHRVRAARELEHEFVPAVVIDQEDDAHALTEVLRVGMNKLRGELDLSGVGTILADLQQNGWGMDDLVLSGFNESEINDLIDTATRDVDEDLSGMTGQMPDIDPPAPRPFLIEILFADREEYQQARKGLRRAAGKGNELSVGLMRLLGEQ